MPNSEMLELARLMERDPDSLFKFVDGDDGDEVMVSDKISPDGLEWSLIIEALRIAGAVDKATTHDR